MNLQEFIDSRMLCPICDTALITQFISGRKQKIRLEDNKVVVVFVLKAMQLNQPDYEVGYAFNPNDNTFCIEFYSEWGNPKQHHDKQVPMHLIEKFREFHKNLMSTNSTCRFYRNCKFCNRYMKSSTSFSLDLKTGKIDTGPFDGLQVGYEAFGLTIPSEDGVKIMYLNNFHSPVEQSKIMWYRGKNESDARLDWMIPSNKKEVTVSLIPFISKEETTKRVNNLLTFA